ncbi:MAG: chorismate synthase, partial [Kiritimatiellae bacterium]|nr:chorismate synthase [Kiritimatiellia bacterium]
MSIGRFLRLDVRGASHARKMTFALENFPRGFHVDFDQVAAFMARRAPGRDALSTQRRETDEVAWRRGFAPGG